MGGSKSKEPSENLHFHYDLPMPPFRARETTEGDPVITTVPVDTQLSVDQWGEFIIAYQAQNKPVQITVMQVTKRATLLTPLPTKETVKCGLLCMRITNAEKEHAGTYTVEVMDTKRPERHGANPVKASWEITVGQNDGHEDARFGC